MSSWEDAGGRSRRSDRASERKPRQALFLIGRGVLTSCGTVQYSTFDTLRLSDG
jgi:hypothetical protein